MSHEALFDVDETTCSAFSFIASEIAD